ncbi:MAG: outer membrane protein [Acidobacteriota bacterium]
MVLIGAVLASSLAWGQNYAGLSVGRSRVSGACEAGGECASRSTASKVFVGGAVEGPWQNWGMSGYELSYIRFGRGVNRYTAPLPQQTADAIAGIVPLAYGDYQLRTQSAALTAAVVARYALMPNTSVSAKAGLAYVTASFTTNINGPRSDQETASHFRPYLGLGVEQQVMTGLRVTLGADWTRYAVAASKGSLTMLGLGIQQDF